MSSVESFAAVPVQEATSQARAIKVLIIAGLVLGGVLGMAGTFVAGRNLQASLWAIDGVGVIVATALLSLRSFRAGDDCTAAGFLIFAIGESVMSAGDGTTLAGSVPSYAAGTALWATALLMTSIPKHFAMWARGTGVIAGVLFAITAGRIFWGEPILPTAAPLPALGYPFLVLTFVGWIYDVARKS